MVNHPKKPASDDAPIGDDVVLWRQVGPNVIVNGRLIEYIVEDKRPRNKGRCRPSSLAFCNSSGTQGMSVLVADIVSASGRQPKEVTAPKRPYITSFTAGQARSEPCNQIVELDSREYEKAHAEVRGKKSPKVRKALVRRSIWVIEPDPSECQEPK